MFCHSPDKRTACHLYELHNQIAHLSKLLVTIRTDQQLFSSVNSTMHNQIATCCELFVTVRTCDRLFTRVQWRSHEWVWVGSNPPTFKKGTHEIFANPKTFLGVGVGGGGGWVEREKHELCQNVLNKQQHLRNVHDAIITSIINSL